MLAGRRQRLDFLLASLQRTTKEALKGKQHRLGLLVNRLAAINPAVVLGRGYGMVTKHNRLVSSVKVVEIDDELQLTLADGSLRGKTLAKKESVHKEGGKDHAAQERTFL